MLTISANETLVSRDFADLSMNSIKNSIHDGDYDSHKVSVYVTSRLIYANDDSNVAF